MKNLNVFFEGQLVGVFSQDEELLHSFKYDEKWRESEASFPISISMPLSEETFGNKITLSFFENLLPEGEVRKHLEKWHKSKGVFNTLLKHGEDCAGALVITGEENPPILETNVSNVEVRYEDLYKAIDESKSAVDLIAEMKPGYLSVAGAQDKFPCILENGKIYLPKSGMPTTHIVKTPIMVKGVKESVYNEYFCMKLAAKIGMNVPEVQIIEGEYPLFVIKRYDRYLDSDQVKRLHQQDFCQAIGITSDEKYEAEGGPDLVTVYKLMLENVTARKRIESSFRFIDWICFNLLIGNNDSHAKNLSFLMTDKKHDLSPFYDLISTAIYPNISKSFSFKVGGAFAFEKMGKKRLALEESLLGIKEGTIAERMSLVYKNILAVQDELIEEISLNFPEVKIHKRIRELILKRAKFFIKAGIIVK
ncbi:type II toxin-antitoxin system HipA family toxin [Halobacteriovorax sp. HLS]|uniref:type II toxin-antitoxin system HipA family toxin n=1 Tax=Halobacteriovorax sp. HLS TaxID=2234000 RepID=UPI000FDBC885|nr:type II toxin-antitoxin system HipA family toxin [Halobacteriovorax sp. HLS]